MKKYLFIAVAAIAAFSGCSKDNPLNEASGSAGKVFNASIEETKTTLAADKKVKWSAGDVIVINGKNYTADAGGNTHTSFTKVGEEATPEGGYYYAYYPSDVAPVNNSGTATLQSQQTYTEGTLNNIPMYAASTDDKLAFKNICGVLAIKVTNTDIATLKSIKLSSSNHDMSGAFSVDASNNAVLTSDAMGAREVELVASTALTMTAEGTVFYIAVPPQTYQDIRIQLSSDGFNYNRIMTTKTSTDIVVARNTIYPLNFVIDGALSSVFTINSSGDKVRFSKGNLKYQLTGSPGWGFFENQYDCDPGAGSASSTDYVSLFYWGLTANSTVRDHTTYVSAHTTDGDVFDYATEDWGSQLDDAWRTLTGAEWKYLCATRIVNGGTGAGYTFVNYTYLASDKVTIEGNDYRGSFIFPDGYTGTTDMSALTWAQINAAGIVFLPAAGYRYNNTTLFCVGEEGYYWASSSKDATDVYAVQDVTGSGLMYANYHDRSNIAYSVRLVTKAD